MAQGDRVVVASTGVADASSVTLDGSESSTNAVDVTELAGTGSADIYREVDTAGDDSWAASFLIDQVTGNWHSQKDILHASNTSSTEDVRIRVENTSGGAADFMIFGYEV